jgi:uncharacterized protein YlxW (UPF0749 family)
MATERHDDPQLRTTASEPEPEPASEPEPETRAWARIAGALRRPSRGQLVAAVLLAVLAFAAVTQVRLTGGNDRYAGMRQADLVQVLNGLSTASRRAEADLSRLEEARTSLRSRSQRRTEALRQARAQLASLGILAGTIPATGPGVVVTVTEQPGRHLKVTDLLDGIEELRDAGAEAMQLNDRVRVVAQTSFEEAPGGLRVDGQVLHAPYIIEAIGGPDTLARALTFPGGFSDGVQYDGGRVAVRKQQTVKVTVTRPPASPTFAHAADGAGGR